MRKAFNLAAMTAGAGLTIAATVAFFSGFAGCDPATTVGACINPGAVFATPLGIAGCALVGGMGMSLYSVGHKNLCTPKPAGPK